jgi:hypothetical protein
LSENLKGRNQLGNPGVEESVLLRLMVEKQDMRVWTGFIWLRTGFLGWLL